MEIQGGLRIRPGSSQGAPLIPYDGWDPYKLADELGGEL